MTTKSVATKSPAPRFNVSRERLVTDKMTIFGIGQIQSLPREKQCVSDMHDACRALRRDSGPAYLGTLLHSVQKATGMRIDIFADIDFEDEDADISDEIMMFSEVCHSTASQLEKNEARLMASHAEVVGNVICFEAYRRRRGLPPVNIETAGPAD